MGRGLLGPGISAVVASVVLAVLVPDEVVRRSGDIRWGSQVDAALVSAVAVVVVLLALLRTRAPRASG